MSNSATDLSSSPVDADTAGLTVNTPNAIGTARGPQVVGCAVALFRTTRKEITKSFRTAAKIYDTLYYNFKTSICCYPEDCGFEADKDYRNESAACEHLRKHGQSSSLAPEFYGFWSLTLPITINGKPQTRKVRLVLIELFDAVSIQATCIQISRTRARGRMRFAIPRSTD